METASSDVRWVAVNGIVSGKVEAVINDNYLVRLPNGKCVIVNEKSILK